MMSETTMLSKLIELGCVLTFESDAPHTLTLRVKHRAEPEYVYTRSREQGASALIVLAWRDFGTSDSGYQRIPRAGRRDPLVIATLVTVRDSSDLGIDRGTICHVVWRDERVMDLWVPSLDTTIARVSVTHPDLTCEV